MPGSLQNDIRHLKFWAWALSLLLVANLIVLFLWMKAMSINVQNVRALSDDVIKLHERIQRLEGHK
jgi:hypothetical protein